jgi:formate hydrogenlyase subunit 3/multisubunit Na+/H+ antiporter MnhD subunit
MGRNRTVLLGAAVIIVSIVLLAVLVVFVTGYLQKYLEINYNVDPLLTTVLLAIAVFAVVAVLFKKKVPER